MSKPQNIEKDDWNTILSELDEIVRELDRFSAMAQGDKDAFEGEQFPALIHFISELKKEKKNQSWEKVENFAKISKENLKLLEETQQIKMQNKRIDRSFIGVLPKNTDEIGKNAMDVLCYIPDILRTVNESVEAMLIDIKLKLGFPIVKIEKEILDIKHQVDLLEEEIKSHLKIKKSLLNRDEKVVYVQAFRETYHEIIEKAQNYLIRDFKAHSRAFEDVYERYQIKLNNYRESPAFDAFIKENCAKVDEIVETWPTKGFKVFKDAQKFIRKIDHRLSDTRQTFIQQIKAELESDTAELFAQIESLYALEAEMDIEPFTKMKQASEKIISAANFLVRTIDVVAEDPHEKLINDEKILTEATIMLKSAYEGTFGRIEEKLDSYTKQVALSKDTKKLLDLIKETKENAMDPNNLIEAIETIPNLIDFKKTLNLLLKEIAVDINDTQEKHIKKIKNINKFLGEGESIAIPADSDLIKIAKVDLDDQLPLKKIEELLKSSLAEASKVIANFEEKYSEGLGISINPNLEGKISRYRRPSYKPTIKQANKAMSDLEKFAKNLAKDTGVAINEFAKELKKFPVNSSALKALQTLLKSISKEATSGKLNLVQITSRLEQAISEYSKLINAVISEHSDEITLIMKDETKMVIGEGMQLENFGLKHDELIANISLENVVEQKEEEEKPELKCKTCGAPIVWQDESYNDMLGLDVLKIRCKNNHEENIIGFSDDTEEPEEDILELKCSKCDSETLNPTMIDLYTKKKLVVIATCPKKHKTEFNIKKK